MDTFEKAKQLMAIEAFRLIVEFPEEGTEALKGAFVAFARAYAAKVGVEETAAVFIDALKRERPQEKFVPHLVWNGEGAA